MPLPPRLYPHPLNQLDFVRSQSRENWLIIRGPYSLERLEFRHVTGIRLNGLLHQRPPVAGDLYASIKRAALFKRGLCRGRQLILPQ